ncbi:MAG: type II toxin-antitoxin system Phd/YefM family antitoxin [Myxococcales bacterium]|nr:type II toxin-antitoxin system Phd/YefM family antitoxin [Myxococcales bacterium]
MIRLNVHEAKTHLSRHLERLEKGDEDVIVLCRRNQPIAEIRALPRRRKTRRPMNLADPRFKLSPRFFEPLPEEVIAGFEGETT